MNPVLKTIREKFPGAHTIHFWSDGPSKQYKNKKNFSLLCDVPKRFGFQRATWNFFADCIGATVKRTADSLLLQGNDVASGKTFYDMVKKSVTNIQLFYVKDEEMACYDELIQPLKPVPGTRKVIQVIPEGKKITCRSLSCFCSEPKICQCFTPAMFDLHEHVKDKFEKVLLRTTSGSSASAQHTEIGPVAMLIEEMEQDCHEVSEGVHTKMAADHINCGDWLAVIYDKNWWLAKVIIMDTHHQDVKVKFFHPNGPSTQFHPKRGARDVGFIPVHKVLVKLTEPSPTRACSTREIFHLSPEVMDYIEREHIQFLMFQ